MQRSIFSPHSYSPCSLRRYGKHNRRDDPTTNLQSPLCHYLLKLAICIGERLGCNRQAVVRTLRPICSGPSVWIGSDDSSSCISFTGFVGRSRLELKSDGKISSKSAPRRRRMERLGLREDALVSEQTASDRNRPSRTAAGVCGID